MSDKAKRERGSGSIYTDARSGIVWIKYHDAGTPYRESTGKRGQEGRAAAKNLLKAKLGDITRGTFAAGADKLRMRDLGKLVLDDYETKERKSLRRARASVAHLVEFFASTPAKRIAVMVPEYIKARRKETPKPAAATIRNELAILRRSFTLAVRAGLLASRPLFESVPVNNARQGFADEKTFAKVLIALPEYLRAPVSFGFETAWRRGEWTSLRWADVDLDAGEIRLAGSSTKSGEIRVLPLAGRVREIIEAQHERTKAWEKEHRETVPLVFWEPTLSGAKPLGDFRDEWEAATKAACVPWLLVHDLRRSRARIWSNKGVPDRVGMALGGWKTRSIYDRYGIVAKSDMTAALEGSTNTKKREA